VLAHLSFVVILVGVFLTHSPISFQDQNFVAPIGDRVAVGHGTGLAVEATSFDDTYYDNGSPKDYVSVLALYKDGVLVKTQSVRVNHPLTSDGVSFYQSFFGMAARMKVTDAAGKAVYQQGVPLGFTSDDGARSIGQFKLPANGLTVEVALPASGKTDPEIKPGRRRWPYSRTGQERCRVRDRRHGQVLNNRRPDLHL